VSISKILDYTNGPHPSGPHTMGKCGMHKDEAIAKWSGGRADHRREANGFSHTAKILNACNMRTDVLETSGCTFAKGNSL